MERVTRLVAATFVFVGGLIHLELWLDGYRGIPYVGLGFIANVVLSAVLVVALLGRPAVPVGVVSVAFSATSLLALVMSRTVGLFGFTETAWTDASVQAASAEIGAIVAVAVLLAMRARSTAMVLRPVPVSSRTVR